MGTTTSSATSPSSVTAPGTVRARHRQAPVRGSARRGTAWARTRAVLAAGVVVGVGSAATLASWTDTEWVWGGSGDGRTPGLAAGVFEVQQNVWDGPGGAADFVDRETEGEAGELDFTLAASALSPGDTVYAPMQLRAIAGSDGADLTLDGALLRDGSAEFFDALRYGVRVDVPRGSCTAAAFGSTGSELVAAGSSLGTGSGSTGVEVTAGGATTPGTAVDLCFAVTLPADAGDELQGLGASPSWAFQALSG